MPLHLYSLARGLIYLCPISYIQDKAVQAKQNYSDTDKHIYLSQNQTNTDQ